MSVFVGALITRVCPLAGSSPSPLAEISKRTLQSKNSKWLGFAMGEFFGQRMSSLLRENGNDVAKYVMKSKVGRAWKYKRFGVYRRKVGGNVTRWVRLNGWTSTRKCIYIYSHCAVKSQLQIFSRPLSL